jgi:nucleolar protein 58
LRNFQKFDSAVTAVEEAAAVIEGKVTPRLASLLDSLKDEKKASLAVADPKLGTMALLPNLYPLGNRILTVHIGLAIGKLPGLSIQPIADSSTADIYRAIREHLPTLIPGLVPEDMSAMALGLSHSLARHKLKFSPDKIDTMIVQAIALLDDLDKELNTYAMRVKEWYGWHFPEMAKIINDNLAYAKVVLKMGMRTNWEKADLAEILPEEIEGAVKTAADRSMGTEISPEDLENIQALAEQVVGFSEYRQQLASYLTARMTAIAPNLTALVGELVGARLIAHAGSLMNLSKNPASTIQILGAEKALFRALKTKHDTPKYGLIYHASLIGQATGRNKGKMARVLAAKASLGIRVDALAEWEDDVTEEDKAALGMEARYNLERKLAAMEGKPMKPRGVAIAPNGVSTQPKKFEISEARKYNADADGLDGNEPPAAKKDKKEKKEKKLIEEVDAQSESEDESDEDVEMEDKPQTNGTTHEDESSDESDEDDKKKHKSKKGKKQSELEKLAEKAGLSVKRYQRKLERGEIKFDSEGNPIVISKKEMKKARKEAKKAVKEEAKKEDKKRKRTEEDGEEVSKAEKKKKKKSKE